VRKFRPFRSARIPPQIEIQMRDNFADVHGFVQN
jgi:hypothetical protein